MFLGNFSGSTPQQNSSQKPRLPLRVLENDLSAMKSYQNHSKSGGHKLLERLVQPPQALLNGHEAPFRNFEVKHVPVRRCLFAHSSLGTCEFKFTTSCEVVWTQFIPILFAFRDFRR